MMCKDRKGFFIPHPVRQQMPRKRSKGWAGCTVTWGTGSVYRSGQMTAEREQHARRLLRWIYEVLQIDARGDELISWLTFGRSRQNIDVQLIQSMANTHIFHWLQSIKAFSIFWRFLFFFKIKQQRLPLLLHIDWFLDEDCNGSTSTQIKA